MNESDGILSQEEIKNIILALGHGQNTFTDSDIALAIEWARNNRIAESCLNLVLSGKLSLEVIDGEVLMNLPDTKRKELAPVL